MKDRAQALIATGDIGADVLGQLDALKTLQLDQLAKQVAEAADVFGQANKGLRQWLDQNAVSASAELSPVAARAQALADYQRVLAQAQSDPEARGQLTGYADRLLSADRAATDSAQARLELNNQIRAEIAALASSSSASDPVVTQLRQLGVPLSSLVLLTQKTATANDNLVTAVTPALAVSVANIPSLKTMYGEVFSPQTDRVVAALGEVKAVIGELKTLSQHASNAVQASLDDLISVTEAGLEAVAEASAQSADELATIRKDGTVARAAASDRAAA